MRNPSSVSRRISSRRRAGLAQRRLVDQQAGRGRRPAPDPAAQLVQLRQAEALGPLDHHDRGVGHVHPHLDHRRRDQHLGLARRRSAPSPRPSRPAASGRGPARRRPRPAPRAGAGTAPRRRSGRSSRSPRPAGRPSRPAAPRPPRARRRSTTSSIRAGGDQRGRSPASGPAASRPAPTRPCRRIAPGSATARDRRRGHHQHVRPPAPWRPAPSAARTPKRCCSSITARRRSWNVHVLLEHRMGADQDLDLARRPAPPASPPAPRPLSRPVSISSRTPARLGQRAQPVQVLAREDLGRGHHHALPARLDRDQQRHERDQRLARADIALQQPVHPLRRGHVGGDLGDRAAPARRSGGRAAPPAPCACSRPSPARTARPLPRAPARASASVSWCANSSS